MKKWGVILIIIILFSGILYERNKTSTIIDLSYPVWEDSKLTRHEEFVVWKRNALLRRECTYTVWEENEISRNNPLTVWRME